MNRFDYVAAAIEESKDLEIMILSDLQASLEACEMWMNERLQNTMKQALKAQVNLRNKKEITSNKITK